MSEYYPESELSSELDVVEPSPNAFKTIADWVIVIVVALLAALLIRVFVFQQFYISGPSMQTTLFDNNRVLVNKLSYKLHDIRRGDVVVFEKISTDKGVIAHDDLIKRVIGIEGDTVAIKDCNVIVNGKQISEPYLNKEDLANTDLMGRCRIVNLKEQTVPKDKVFVMGDNRPESFDSRMFGPIDEDLVIGRAFVILWPLGRIGWL